MITTEELIVFNCQSVVNNIMIGPAQKVEELTWYVNHTYHLAQMEWAIKNGFPISRLSEEEIADMRGRNDVALQEMLDKAV